MNVTVYPESKDWLFATRPPDHTCMWAFGRHEPPVEIGDDLLFCLNGMPVGRAIVRRICKPGEYNMPMHDGSRELRGWKVMWFQGDFEDLRWKRLPRLFTKAMTPAMRKQLWRHDHGVIHTDEADQRALAGLLKRGLVRRMLNKKAWLTVEGWRVVLREISEQRRTDIANGLMCCRICGCTPNHGRDERRSWSGVNLCNECDWLMENRGKWSEERSNV